LADQKNKFVSRVKNTLLIFRSFKTNFKKFLFYKMKRRKKLPKKTKPKPAMMRFDFFSAEFVVKAWS